MSESTLTDYLAIQDSLVHEASVALPHSFANCTYNLGYIRQPVYLCFTCASTRGICAACSIACHTNHEQLELFPKRKFRCDCPTTALAHPCTLHTTPQLPNDANEYGQNFTGKFCRCGREYDANKERETMIQCLACEDWYHESCLNLRERPPSRDPSPVPEPLPDENDDASSTTSSSGLPPPLLKASDYDVLICAACVACIPIVRRYAGTAGVLVVGPGGDVQGHAVEDGGEVDVDREAEAEAEVEESGEVGSKRTRGLSVDLPDAKRPRGESSTGCIAPTALSEIPGAGDVFLTEGWRERWCRCSACLPSLEAHAFLLHDEDTYEPPVDPDSGLSLEELGMRALRNIPRDRAIDGIQAFNAMRDELVAFLRPFQREGKVVREADVKGFFEKFRTM